MRWKCKLCTYVTNNRRKILGHYRSSHCHYGGRVPVPCIYSDCVCSFKSHKALGMHVKQHGFSSGENVNFRVRCLLCAFNQPATLKQYFCHLNTHLRNKETVTCPFNGCTFKSKVYSSFTSHRSRYHALAFLENVKAELLYGPPLSENSDPLLDAGGYSSNNTESADGDCFDFQSDDDDNEERDGIADKIRNRLASLLLRMQAVLHVSKSATQEIVNELHEIGILAGELSKKTAENIFTELSCNIDEVTLKLLKETLQETNPFSCLSQSGPLGTEYKRQLFYKERFNVIEPTEYVLDPLLNKTFVYVPISCVLPALLNKCDVIDNVIEETNVPSLPGQYRSFYDGLYFKENPILSQEQLSISLGLYVDEFEICNPLGTSRKKHKITAIYWVIANLPAKYRSALSSIYLALLSNSNDVKTFGYAQI
ncbi:hypothetical protein MHYP_G00320800, partial [Metynnis hypsauchen]